ncbi:MAG: RibD family protein [Mycobacteriales bacterium]
MPPRPYVLLSCAVSLDGCLDDSTARRLVLSGPADLDRVDAERAHCDAILVGAGTVRRDDPRLLVRSAARRRARVQSGRAASPVKVTLTRSGDLDPAARFFPAGTAERLVYCATPGLATARDRLATVATVLEAGPTGELDGLLADLAGRGVRRLLVEGGGAVLSGFLCAGLADELQLAVAPLFVGDPRAPRFLGPARPAGAAGAAGAAGPATGERARLVEVRPVGDVALLRYALSDRAL